MISIKKIPYTKEEAYAYMSEKITEIIIKEPIEGIEELWLKVQSGFYASFIVADIYNHANNKLITS